MALWLGAGPSVVRARAGRPPRAHRPHQGLLLGRTDVADPLAVAASLDVLAVCLAAGMAVSTAAAATAAVAPPRLARVLRRAADLLALGADPNIAWSRPPDLPPGTHDAQTDAVLRLARRSAASGAALPRTRTKSRHRRRLPQSPGPHWRHCPPTDAPTAPEWAHSANRARSAAARRWRPRRPHRRPHLWPRPARTAHGTPPPAH